MLLSVFFSLNEMKLHNLRKLFSYHEFSKTQWIFDQNFLIAQSEDKANNGILRFQRGHPFLEMYLKEIVDNFNSGAWGANGPDRITDTARNRDRNVG